MENSAQAGTAVAANDFLNSIGVCTHIQQGIDDPTNVATCLIYTGIRNFRDAGSTTTVMQKYIDIHNASGAKVCLLAMTNSNLPASIAAYKRLQAAGALMAVEGPNEPNNFPVIYNGETSGYNTTFLPVARYQRDLYNAVQAESELAGIPVFHSSSSSGPEPDNVGLQYLTIPTPLPSGVLMPAGTRYADYANCHNYVIGNGQTAVVDNNAWNAASPTQVVGGSWDGLYGQYGVTWRRNFAGYTASQLQTLPRVSTETGWTTSGTNSITEAQQADLFLNLYLAQYKRGWKHTFIYMLRDHSVQGYWGLVRTDYSYKPSATYLHNMTTILADTGSITPGSLDYSIPSQPATVHDLLMQKSNGIFFLAVWNERTSGSNNITVNLGAAYPTVKVYDPTLGTAAIQTFSNVSSVALTLSDHPNIIEITPVAGSSLPAPWANQNIGSVGTAGSAGYASGTFTVNGSGWDISGTADSFHYVYQTASGNCSITARLATQQNTSTNAKAGVMIRETLAADSKSATLFLKPPAGGAYFRWRVATGGNSTGTYASGGAAGAPYWLRLERVGNTFTAYKSTDNVQWTQVGTPQTISMESTVYIGLAQCSATSTLGTSTFDNVTATP